MITKREAAIISAYTGYMLGTFSDMHEYAESIMGRPCWTHEFGSKDFCKRLREKARPDFVAIEIEGEERAA